MFLSMVRKVNKPLLLAPSAVAGWAIFTKIKLNKDESITGKSKGKVSISYDEVKKFCSSMIY